MKLQESNFDLIKKKKQNKNSVCFDYILKKYTNLNFINQL